MDNLCCRPFLAEVNSAARALPPPPASIIRRLSKWIYKVNMFDVDRGRYCELKILEFAEMIGCQWHKKTWQQ